MTEAAVSGLLAVTLEPSTHGLSPDRFLDALVGSGVALGMRAFFPGDPRRSVERAAHPIFEELAAVLRETASALSAGDVERAERALYRAREVDARIGGLKEALAAGYQTARLSLSRRRALGQLGRRGGDRRPLWDRNDLETSVMVGQIRSTAVDLLRASGMDSSAALQVLREAQLNAAVAKAPVE